MEMFQQVLQSNSKNSGENLMVVETNGEHCHESDKRKCERQQL
jgi:hypothetical protein